MEDKFVFIDRDGVINKDGQFITEHGYITRWEDFEFLPGVLEALKKLKGAGYKSVVISNQKCVAKGLLTEKNLAEITGKYMKAVEEYGGKIEKAFYCLHTDEDNCGCRKPDTGLFHKAAEDLGIKTLKGKYYIGDSERDMKAGQSEGMKTIFVLSGKNSRENAEKWQYKPDIICEGLLDAVNLILEQK